MEIGTNILLTTSKRDKKLAVVGDHKYRFFGSRRADGFWKWRCSSRKSCTAFIYTKPGELKVEDVSGEHSGEHPANLNKVHLQALRKNCERAAEKFDGRSLDETVRAELERLKRDHPSVTLAFGVCAKSVRKAAYDRRRRAAGQRSADAPLRALRAKLRAGGRRFAFAGQRFVHAPEGKRFVCATTAANVSFLCRRCTGLFAETSGRLAPEPFSWVYILHGLCPGGAYVPLVYFVLADRARETLADAWAHLKTMCEESGSDFNFETLHVEFVTAAHEAVKTHFPGVRVQGRVFDFTGMWMDKIRSDDVLRRAYEDVDSPLGKWLKQMFDLRFLPSSEVADAFEKLVALCPNVSDGTKFSDYILEKFIREPHCEYPPNIWAEEPKLNPTKTIGPEYFVCPYPKVSLHMLLTKVFVKKQREVARVIKAIGT